MKETRFRSLGSAWLVLIAMGGSARADLLGLTLLPSPDIMAGFIDVTYDAGTDAFSATGFALELDGNAFDAMGTFEIAATIDDTGALGAGTVSIEGTVAGSGPSLLTGDLTAFGFSTSGGDPLEFLFDVTGGALAGLFGGVGAEVGIVLDLLSAGSFGGSFGSDFDNGGVGSGVADVAPIPAPGAALLGLIGLGMVGKVRRRYSR